MITDRNGAELVTQRAIGKTVNFVASGTSPVVEITGDQSKLALQVVAVDPTITLLDGLVSAWPLSVDGSDAHAANDLTNNNAVTFVPRGPSGVVADFVAAASESLTVADNASLSLGADSPMMVSAWVRPTGASDGQDAQIAKWGGAGNAFDIEYAFNNTGAAFTFTIGDGVGANGLVGSTGITPTVGQWYFLIGWHDPVADTINLSVNGAEFSAAWAGGTFDGTGTLALSKAGSFASYLADQNLGRAGVWIGSFLGPTERTSLYNSGAGKSYADLTVAEKVGLVSYWNLDEASGSRLDSHGSNTLTDNNTVGSVTNAPANMPGTVANFVVASAQFFSRAAVAGLPTWTVAAWYKGFAVDNYEGIFLLSNGWDVPTNFMIYRYPTGNANVLSVRLSASNTVPTGFEAQNASAGSPTDWHLLLGTFDGSTLSLYVDNGAANTAALTGTIYTAAANLRVGATMLPNYVGGNVSSPMWWNRELTVLERAQLYSLGSGSFYPFTPPVVPALWDVRLEGSLDGENWTTLLTHVTATGNGYTRFGGVNAYGVRYVRTNVASLALGSSAALNVAWRIV